jgi:hypothetical protein
VEPLHNGVAAGIVDELLDPLRQLLILDQIVSYHFVTIEHPQESQLEQLSPRSYGYDKLMLVLVPVQGITFLDQFSDQILNLAAIKPKLQVAILHFMTAVHGHPPSCIIAWFEILTELSEYCGLLLSYTPSYVMATWFLDYFPSYFLRNITRFGLEAGYAAL